MKEQVEITEHAKKGKDGDFGLRFDLKTLDMEQHDVLSMVMYFFALGCIFT